MKPMLVLFLVASVAGAQTISNAYPGFFVDISPAGTGTGAAITPVDDSSHPITTTVGNGMFPAGPVTINNNGWAAVGTTTSYGGHYNDPYDIMPTGVPASLIPGLTHYMLAHQDDLLPNSSNPTAIYWQEIGGILYIQWNKENHYYDTVAGNDVTFQIQVFSNPGSGPYAQFLYADTTFGGSYASADNGASATVGYVDGTPNGTNAKWSHMTASLSAGLVLSLFPPLQMAASSPFGPGSLQVDITSGPTSGSYFMGITLNAGSYPNGWLFGLDIPYPEFAAEYNAGWPFQGVLNGTGSFSVGPLGGIPSGLTFFGVAVAWPGGAPEYPYIHSPPMSYTIP